MPVLFDFLSSFEGDFESLLIFYFDIIFKAYFYSLISYLFGSFNKIFVKVSRL